MSESKHTPNPPSYAWKLEGALLAMLEATEWDDGEESGGDDLAEARKAALAVLAEPHPTHDAAPDLLAALESGGCPCWVHNAAHTNDIEALRAIALWHADWNNNIRIAAITRATGA